MENVKEIHKHHFITVNGDEYPLFDDDITVEENECVEKGAFKRNLREIPVEERTLHKDQTKLF